MQPLKVGSGVCAPVAVVWRFLYVKAFHPFKNTEHLLRARHCSGHWEYSSGQDPGPVVELREWGPKPRDQGGEAGVTRTRPGGRGFGQGANSSLGCPAATEAEPPRGWEPSPSLWQVRMP